MADNLPADQPAEPAPGHDGQKKETARISLESARPPKSPLNGKKATSPIPGLSEPGVPARPAGGPPIPQTIRLKRPPTSQIAVQPVTPPPPPAIKVENGNLSQAPTAIRQTIAETIKRQTAPIRPEEPATPKKIIDLRQTTGPILGIPTHTGPIPQTIRLKRPPTSPLAAQSPQPTVSPTVVKMVKSGPEVLAEAPTVSKEVLPPKGQTSRIVLEEPIIAPGAAKQATARISLIEPGQPPVPKTIRLKRPPSVSAEEEPAPEAKAEQEAQVFRKTETSKIELPVAPDAATAVAPPRKTLKIKRSDRQPAIPTVAATVPEEAVPAAAEPVEEDRGLIFPVVAAAATVCIAALVYIMAAQALGLHLPLPAAMQLH